MKRILSLLFILPLGYSCSVAQNSSKYANVITEESSKNHLIILASKDFAGRGTNQEGGEKTAKYIADQFKSFGLKPLANGSYYQPVSLVQVSYKVDQFKLANKEFVYGKDFYVQGDNTSATFNADDIVFVGYGIQDEKFNELKNIDISGKVILIINESEPVDAQGNSIITGTRTKSTWATSRFKRLQELTKLNPKLILAAGSQNEEMIKRMNNRGMMGRVALDKGNSNLDQRVSTPIVHIGNAITDQLLGSINTNLVKFKSVTSTTPIPAKIIKSSLNASMGVKNEKFTDPNVIGYLEGTDLKDEVIVVCGHWDHDGILPDGTFFPGADDNGSGTVGVVEIAKAFSQAKKDGKGSRRSILFIGLAAEEKGLLGSEYYVENPIFPLTKTVACINIDMIGRIDDKHLNGDHNYIHVIGVNKLSTDLKPIVEKANSDIKMKLDYDYDHPEEPMRLYYRSDHYNFAKNGIPSLFFFSGLHPHYHTPEDTVDKIDFPMMVKREKLIFNVTWEIANRDKKPVVDMPLEDAKGTGR
ncbi:M28 family peptidase [Sphingobacterium bovistauri]|uniref:M28 family peptidase n=1 Tax=Sphingobacterium bovistauri TaxID=2781959 RepID=A0ABS7Z301_9SPHI|nr:M28 family peptidase [Sphingobacterium bovistauri]MCA5004505.1 M28 family peptidase [Sphingobacterium bovistauri]